jgi:hypothetical protein
VRLRLEARFFAGLDWTIGGGVGVRSSVATVSSSDWSLSDWLIGRGGWIVISLLGLGRVETESISGIYSVSQFHITIESPRTTI